MYKLYCATLNVQRLHMNMHRKYLCYG